MLIRQTLAYFPAQILGPLIQFATAISLTHYLGPAEYGMTMLVFVSQELVFLVCLSWWTIYMLRYAGTITDPVDLEKFEATERTIVILTALLQIVVILVIILLTEPEVPALFYAGAVVFTITRSFLNLLSERARKSAAILDYSLLQILAPGFGLLLTLAAFHAFRIDPSAVLLLFAAAQFAVGVIVSSRLGRAGMRFHLEGRFVRAALAFGVPVVLASSFGWIASNGVRFVVQGLDGPSALGLLSVGWGIATRLAAVAALVVTAAAYPLAVRMMESGDEAGAKNQLGANSALLFAIVAPATLGVIAITEPLTRLLIAAEYHAATIAILPWAIAGAAIRNLRMHGWDQLYLLAEAPKPMMVLEVSEAFVTVVAAIMGMLVNGVIGAVIGTTLAAAAVAAVDWWFLRTRFGLPLPASSFLRAAIAALVMFAALRIMMEYDVLRRPHWIDLGLTITIGAIVYALGLLVLFSSEIRQSWKKFRRPMTNR